MTCQESTRGQSILISKSQELVIMHLCCEICNTRIMIYGIILNSLFIQLDGDILNICIHLYWSIPIFVKLFTGTC